MIFFILGGQLAIKNQSSPNIRCCHASWSVVCACTIWVILICRYEIIFSSVLLTVAPLHRRYSLISLGPWFVVFQEFLAPKFILFSLISCILFIVQGLCQFCWGNRISFEQIHDVKLNIEARGLFSGGWRQTRRWACSAATPSGSVFWRRRSKHVED